MRRGTLERDWSSVSAATSVLLQSLEASHSSSTETEDVVWRSTLLLLQQHASLKRHAWRYLQHHLAAGTRREQVLLEMALSLVRLGDLSEAYDCINGRIELMPFSANALFHGYLGLIALAISEVEAKKGTSQRRSQTMLERALEHFKRAVELDPEAELFLQVRMALLARSNDATSRRTARAELVRIMDSNTDNVVLWHIVHHTAPLVAMATQAAKWQAKAARHILALDPACAAGIFTAAMEALLADSSRPDKVRRALRLVVSRVDAVPDDKSAWEMFERLLKQARCDFTLFTAFCLLCEC